MTELPKLMHADCGHFIPFDSAAQGQRYDSIRDKWIPVYLCPKCNPAHNVVAEAEFKRGPGRPRKTG